MILRNPQKITVLPEIPQRPFGISRCTHTSQFLDSEMRDSEPQHEGQHTLKWGTQWWTGELDWCVRRGRRRLHRAQGATSPPARRTPPEAAPIQQPHLTEEDPVDEWHRRDLLPLHVELLPLLHHDGPAKHSSLYTSLLPPAYSAHRCCWNRADQTACPTCSPRW